MAGDETQKSHFPVHLILIEIFQFSINAKETQSACVRGNLFFYGSNFFFCVRTGGIFLFFVVYYIICA